MSSEVALTPAILPSGSIVTYEYGVRIDKECLDALQKQIADARRLYNDIVACIREIVLEMNAFTLDKAGPAAATINAEIEALTAKFLEAKAADNEQAMKLVAQERRMKWRDLGAILKRVRSEHRGEIQRNYLARIGRNSGCDTYRRRCAAVAGGLGWATANAVLDAALLAFKKSFQLGRPPRFSVGAEKDQDTLTLQFTAAGGVAAETILTGTHSELSLLPTGGCGRRKYGELKFRLGAAKESCYATGSWQYHRPIPVGATVALARLVRRRVGKDYRWAVQLMIKLPTPIREEVGDRRPLVAIHMGWSADVTGRRIAGIADAADPGAARIIQLPPQIERELARAAEIQGERDAERDTLVPLIKAMEIPVDGPEAVVDVISSIRATRPQYVSANRLHYLCRLLREHEMLPEWLESWRKADRLRWQAHTHIARRARFARRDFYRNLAIDLARRYGAIVIEPLALAEAAKKVDERSGEKTELSRKARSGRVVAALYELETAVRWAAVKTGTAVLDLVSETVARCAMCNGVTRTDAEDGQVLHCDACGAELDRKGNGAARAFQVADVGREDAVEQFWMEANARVVAAQAGKDERLSKMKQGRENARTQSGLNRPGDSRDI